MLQRLAVFVALSMVVPVGAADIAYADPDELVDTGVVASSEAAVITTPDGWTLTARADNETELPIAPLTTATSSREYLVAGTFTGTVTGAGRSKLAGGTFEVGYQIGCGMELNQIRLTGQIGVSASTSFAAPIPSGVSIPMSGAIEVHPKPGQVTQVPVDKKSFKAAPVRVTLKDVHIKIDGCLGQSFLRSYATLTSATEDTDDIVAYYGVTKAV